MGRYCLADMRIAAAASLYFIIVFGAGFVMGPIPVLWLEPRLGQTAAVACEAPFLLAVMVVASRWVPSVVNVPHNVLSLALMGLGALALQQAGDLVVGVALRGIKPAEHLAYFTTSAGLIYAGLLLLFSIMPVLLNR